MRERHRPAPAESPGYTVLLTRRGKARARIWELSKWTKKGRLSRAEPGSPPKVFKTAKAARDFVRTAAAHPKIVATILGPDGQLVPIKPARRPKTPAASPGASIKSLCLPSRTEDRLASAGLATVGQVAAAIVAGGLEAIDERDEAAIRRALPPAVPPRKPRLSTFDLIVATSDGPKLLTKIRAANLRAAEKIARRLDDAQGYSTTVRPARKREVPAS